MITVIQNKKQFNKSFKDIKKILLEYNGSIHPYIRLSS